MGKQQKTHELDKFLLDDESFSGVMKIMEGTEEVTEHFSVGEMHPVVEPTQAIPVTDVFQEINPIDEEYSALLLGNFQEEPEHEAEEFEEKVDDNIKNFIEEKSLPKEVVTVSPIEVKKQLAVIVRGMSHVREELKKYKDTVYDGETKKFSSIAKLKQTTVKKFTKKGESGKEKYFQLTGIIGIEVESSGPYEKAINDIFDSIIKGADRLIQKGNRTDYKIKLWSGRSITADSEDPRGILQAMWYILTPLTVKEEKSNGKKLVKESGEERILFEKTDWNDITLYTEATKIDDDIAPIIHTLNAKGYKTKYSCSGHPSTKFKKDMYRDGVLNNKLYSTARIVFAENYTLPHPPKHWGIRVLNDKKNVSLYVEPPTFAIEKGLQKEQFTKWKKSYMNSLTTWVKNLKPNGSKGAEEDTKKIVESTLEELILDSL